MRPQSVPVRMVLWEEVKKKGSQALRRNPIENRAISSFSGQKSGTRVFLSILKSFLHFRKA